MTTGMKAVLVKELWVPKISVTSLICMAAEQREEIQHCREDIAPGPVLNARG